jgi:hypothetical protein
MQRAGVSIVAISNDDVEALADFAQAHAITYPLIADVDSVVIKRLGILNTLIPEEEAEFHGIPFPGTYIVDADGVVIDKFFENSLAFRPGPEQLLRAALGETIERGEAPDPVDEVAIRAYLDGPSLAPGLVREIVIELVLPVGAHVYGEPVPEGMVATSAWLDEQDGLIVFDARLPPTGTLRLESGEELNIYTDGASGHAESRSSIVEIRIPVTFAGNIGSTGDGATLTVTGSVRFQTCDDVTCSIPQRSGFRVVIPVVPVIVGDFGKETPRTRPMNGRIHMQRLLERRNRPQS